MAISKMLRRDIKQNLKAVPLAVLARRPPDHRIAGHIEVTEI
jgi:hypothetical protein